MLEKVQAGNAMQNPPLVHKTQTYTYNRTHCINHTSTY